MKRAGTVSGVTLTLTLTAAAVGMTLGACQLVGDITDRSLESPGGDDGATLTDSRAPGVDGTVEKDGAPGSRPDANASSDAAIDGGNDATAPECLTNAQCTARASAEATEAGAVAATGDAAFNGILDGGVVPAVCVQSIGKCAPLLTPDCHALYGDYTNDNSILVGTIFNTTGSYNIGSYNSPEANKLINASVFSADPSAVKTEASYLTANLPALFQADADHVYAWKTNLSGPQASFWELPQFSLNPELWYFTGK